MARSSPHNKKAVGRKSAATAKLDETREKSQREHEADRLLHQQIDIPMYALIALAIAHALSGTSSLSLPHLSAHLPHSLQSLFPAWSRHMPSLAPFATELPNASHDYQKASWRMTGSAGPFRSDAIGFGHPLSALHNFTLACFGLSYEVKSPQLSAHDTSGFILDGYGQTFPHSQQSTWAAGWHAESIPKRNEGLLDFASKTYRKGPQDALFVLTGIMVFTVLRAAVINYLLVPLASAVVADGKSNRSQSEVIKRRQRKERRRKIARFSEQAWMALYCSLNLTFGMYIARNEPYWMNGAALWADYPFKQLTGLTKFYYLIQCAFWFQQVLVLNVEEHRKDHWTMFSHHVVTILLLVGSYVYHFTPVGNVILILMDPSDILLSTAKCLKYMGLQTICDVFFGLFMVSWVLTRHILYNLVLRSCITSALKLPAERLRESTTEWLSSGYYPTLTLVILLCMLQFILCLWFVMIVKVAWKVVTGKGAADDRSEDESDDDYRDREKRSKDGDKTK